MPKFDAGAVVEPLDYDFTTIKGYPHKRARGTIPEPSDEQIANLLAALREQAATAGKMVEPGNEAQDFSDPTAFLHQLDNFDPAVFTELYAKVGRAYADLCSGQPSYEEIMSLPMRVRNRFFAWVMEEVVSPEAGTGAGNAAVIPLRTPVAG